MKHGDQRPDLNLGLITIPLQSVVCFNFNEINKKMALLNKIEAAINLGVSVELLEWFVDKCPKYGEKRTLEAIVVGSQQMFDEDELGSFRQYLKSPWPVPKDKTRPLIPGKIKTDIKQESHLSCAICGFMDNGEVAHIAAVAKSLNNSPDNLIYLCPNHHTKYDLGHKPSSNVSIEEIRAAKLVKRRSRARMMGHEADSAKASAIVLDLIKKLGSMIEQKGVDKSVAKVYVAEVKNLLKFSADLSKTPNVSKSESKNGDLTESLKKCAPTLQKLSLEGSTAKTDVAVKKAMSEVIRVSKNVLAALDEVECPHCLGAGTRGLVGDYCVYCRGAQLISSARLEAYDEDAVDEQPCPHCQGRGTFGWNGEHCNFCHGSQYVSSEKAESYDLDDLDEHSCPHCGGKGTTGLSSDMCIFCKGFAVVSKAKLDTYDVSQLDEEPCPACGGRGTTGFAGDICNYCNGSQGVTHAKAEAYNPAEHQKPDCPHCDGWGIIGLNNTFCAYCNGSQKVSIKKLTAYDSSDIDETPCPHCHGKGITGHVGDYCKLCDGDMVVSDEIFKQYSRRKRC